jgi:DNA-binding transcriptional ArsR family regulator
MVKYSDVNLDTVFSALSDGTRRAILERLSDGPASVTQLAQPFRMSIPAVSKHLTVLRDAGLVEIKKDGRIHWISLRSDPMKNAVAWLDRYEKFWNKRLDALEAMFNSNPSKRKRNTRHR